MERKEDSTELDRLTALALGKAAHIEDMVGTGEQEGVLLSAAEELLTDAKRAREAAGLDDPS